MGRTKHALTFLSTRNLVQNALFFEGILTMRCCILALLNVSKTSLVTVGQLSSSQDPLHRRRGHCNLYVSVVLPLVEEGRGVPSPPLCCDPHYLTLTKHMRPPSKFCLGRSLVTSMRGSHSTLSVLFVFVKGDQATSSDKLVTPKS